MIHATLLAVIYLAFISLGLPDSVLGVAWPSMRLGLDQPLQAAGLLTMILTACSAVSGFASGAVLRRLGTGPVVMLSGFLTGFALLGYALAPSFAWLMVLAVPLGLGAGSVDAGLNHFVAEHYSSRHMNWLHGCWGIGATIGPFIMGSALAGTLGWQAGYRNIAAIQLALALLFLLTLRLWAQERSVPGREAPSGPRAPDVKQSPPWAPWLAATLFFVYATVEVGTGLWVASILVDGRRMGAPAAGLWVSCFFGAIMVGRFALGLVARRVGNRRLVRIGLVMAGTGALLFSLEGVAARLSLAGLLLLGLGCAPVYPSLMHETVRRFDADTARKVVGRQVAFAYVGGAVGPASLGLIGAQWGLAAIMPAVLVAVVVLLLLSAVLDRVT